MSKAAELIESGLRARRADRPHEAYRAMSDAVAEARPGGASVDLVRALSGLAQMERDLDRRESAVPLYEEAVDLCRELGETLRFAHTIRHLGQVHHEAGRLDAAGSCLSEALDTYRAHGGPSPLDLANALRPLAILRGETGSAEESKRLWAEARELYGRLGIDAGVEEADDWLARLG